MTVTVTHSAETLTRRLILKLGGVPRKQHWVMQSLHYQPDTAYLHWTREDDGPWRKGKSVLVGQQVIGDLVTTHHTTRINEKFERTDPKPEWLEALIRQHAPEAGS